MTKSFLAAALAAAVMAIAGCGTKASNAPEAVPPPAVKATQARAFEFRSGGAFHIEGFGEWILQFGREGNLFLKHVVRDEVKYAGNFTAAKDDLARLWELVDAAGFDAMRSSTRPGVPDEAKYVFKSAKGKDSRTVEIWKNDALREDKVSALVDFLAGLVTKYAKQTPVLK